MTKQKYFCKKMFAKMFFASSISGIALAFSNVIDAVCVGNAEGKTGLAAIGIISPIYIIYNVLGYGFSIGGSITFTRLISGGDGRKASEHFNEMLELLIAVSVVLAAAGLLFLDKLLVLLGADKNSPDLFAMCRDYAAIIIAALPVFMLNFLFNDFLRCDDGQYRATAAFVAGTLLDFLLNILLVSMLGIGVKGAAIATVIAQIVSVAAALPHFFAKRGALSFHFVKCDLRRCAKSFKIGIATSIDYFYVFLFLLLSNKILMGSDSIDNEMYVAVFDVIMNISYITGSMFTAADETLRPLAGTFYEERNKELSEYSLKLSMVWSYIINTVIITAIVVFAADFSRLFGIRTAEGIALSIKAVRIFSIGTFISGVSIVTTAYLQSVNKEASAMWITTFRSCIFLLPIVVILCKFDIRYFWFAMPAAEFLTVLIIPLIAGKTEKEKYTCFSYMLTDLGKIGDALSRTEDFCASCEMSMKKTNLLLMFVEETLNAIVLNAFKGRKDEYIQLTVEAAENDEFILHIRDSAVEFNLFDMNAKKLDEHSLDSDIDSVGVLMMKDKVKSFYYRRYQGFNMLTIKF